MHLIRYAAKRFAIAIPQLAIIVTAIFFIMRLLPANPVARVVGNYPTPGAIRQAKISLGLNASIPVQYWHFVDGIFHGSLGNSWVTGASVTSEIGLHFPITLQLITLGFCIALVIAIPLGMLTAIHPGGKLDRSVFVYGLFAGAQPDFWWGLMFIFLFVFKAHIFPIPQGLTSVSSGVPTITGFNLVDAFITGNFSQFWLLLTNYLLPACTLAFVLSGPIVKMVRQNMLRFRQSNFVLYARACGLSGKQIAAYTLRSALSPVVTLAGILFGFSLGGAVLIETVFSLNGLGQYAVQRTLQLDYPAIQGVVLVMTGFCLVIYLLMDILYAIIDPRIRY